MGVVSLSMPKCRKGRKDVSSVIGIEDSRWTTISPGEWDTSRAHERCLVHIPKKTGSFHRLISLQFEVVKASVPKWLPGWPQVRILVSSRNTSTVLTRARVRISSDALSFVPPGTLGISFGPSKTFSNLENLNEEVGVRTDGLKQNVEAKRISSWNWNVPRIARVRNRFAG